MFDVRISDEQRAYAQELVDRVNFGNRGRFDGTKERQFIGMLGEVVVADALNIQRPQGKNGYDNGIDFVIFNKNVDLKTMARKYRTYLSQVSNLVASQVAQSQTDVYAFACINTTTWVFTMVGVVAKSGIVSRYLVPKGTTRTRSDGTTFPAPVDMYEIPNREMLQVSTWLQFTWGIDRV